MQTIDLDRLRANAQSYAREFQQARPFPHVIMEEFLIPGAAQKILDEYPAIVETSWDDSKTYKHQRLKHQKSGADGLAGRFFDESAAPGFLSLLSQISGIEELEADPDLFGGGLHQ